MEQFISHVLGRSDISDDEFDFHFTPTQYTFLAVWTLIIILAYVCILVAILHTMWLHRASLSCKAKGNFNLNKFYFFAILVIVGRFVQESSLFMAIKRNRQQYFFRFNYGFYVATFSIILIAVSQITSINTAMLRTRYVNKFINGLKPSMDTLNMQLLVLNIVGVLVEMAVLAYLIVIIIHLYDYYSNFNSTPNQVLTDLIQTANYFVGSIMIACFLLIILSYALLRRTFVQSTNL